MGRWVELLGVALALIAIVAIVVMVALPVMAKFGEGLHLGQ